MPKSKANKSYYFDTPLVKMGQWATLPLDCETWFHEHSFIFFKKHFGIGKNVLVIYDIENGFMGNYIPNDYFEELYSRLRAITKNDYKALEKKLKAFYPLLQKVIKEVDKVKGVNFSKVSNKKLAQLLGHNRTWVQRLTVFDALGWSGEDFWKEPMRTILEKKLGVLYGSEEYNTLLFALTKPEEISSTLKEKREVIKQAISIKKEKTNLQKASKQLAKQFGWMPVFAYGEAWSADHYREELPDVMKRKMGELEGEYEKLKNYTKLRNKEIQRIVKKYDIPKKDLQTFVDFGLALDTRNEAEYFVGYAGVHLVSMVEEIASRFNVSTREIRMLTQQELLDVLDDKIDIHEVLSKKQKFVAWGCDKAMIKRIDFNPQESEVLFNYAEKQQIQTSIDSAPPKGVCASPGKVTGIARIIPTPQDNQRVNQGDILITYATTVDYLPAMKKAAAIITEVGGLTCHAAVVSREFGIPCIVALKNAMTTIKDGQRIEVDANNGKVNVIE